MIFFTLYVPIGTLSFFKLDPCVHSRAPGILDKYMQINDRGSISPLQTIRTPADPPGEENKVMWAARMRLDGPYMLLCKDIKTQWATQSFCLVILMFYIGYSA